MKTTKYLGIWMDNSTAHIIEFGKEITETDAIHSKHEQGSGSNENIMHNKEQRLQTEYYKELGELIKNYDEVVLFGPTNAKVELMNILKADHHFDNIKIEVQAADKMTDNQQVAFVRDYFSK